MSGHTPGTLSLRRSLTNGDVGIVSPGCAGVIAECFEEFRKKGQLCPAEAFANAERLRDCWNALEGIADPSTVPAALKSLREMVDRFESADDDPISVARARVALAKLGAK